MSFNNIKSKLNQRYYEAIKNKESLGKLHNDMPVVTTSEEEKIVNWLSKLRLLYGIPFEYLVISEDLLPIESIKFFYIDNNWVTALIDGAYSIGRATIGDEAHDIIFHKKIDLAASVKSSKIRSLAFSKENTNLEVEIITGFLLRSSAVAEWPGLEINGYEDEQGNELEILRLDHVTPDIIICLFAGTVNCLKIHNPPEALHFGFDPKSENSQDYVKTLKSPEGNPLSIGIDIDSDLYRDVKTSVINITKLAETMTQKLAWNEFTSAEFALQMVTGVDMAILKKRS